MTHYATAVDRLLRHTRTAFVVTLVLGFTAVGCCLAGALAICFGARAVITNSIPRGLYWIAPHSIARNSVVGGCLPRPIALDLSDRGYGIAGRCPGNVLPFFKIAAALPGDTVVVSDRGVAVNGKTWPWSRPLSRDRLGRTLPLHFGTFRIKRGYLFLMGLNPASFDSRYFGAILAKDFATYRPVLVESSIYTNRLMLLRPD